MRLQDAMSKSVRGRRGTMRTLEIDYPDDVLAGIDEAALRSLAREALFVRLYQQGLLSSGRAAALLGITRWDFLDLLGRYGVSSFDDELDLDDELRRAQP
jgi:predicted HTH domain antitoxin